jgi:hypothetical protein
MGDYRSRRTINRPLTGRNRRGKGRCVACWSYSLDRDSAGWGTDIWRELSVWVWVVLQLLVVLCIGMSKCLMSYLAISSDLAACCCRTCCTVLQGSVKILNFSQETWYEDRVLHIHISCSQLNKLIMRNLNKLLSIYSAPAPAIYCT